MAFDSYNFVAGSMIDMQSYNLTLHSHIFGFHDIFETSEELGSGAQGTVLQCRSKEHPSRTYAAKIISTNRLVPKMMAMLEYELQLLNKLNCEARIISPKIVQTFHAYESTDYTYIVMEHMMGGTLTEWRAKRESHSVTELETRVICQSLFEALQFCHERKIAHRDIKLSNLLLARPNDLSSLKIGDFGFAKAVPPTGLTTRCGTPLFLPPEIVLLGSELYRNYDTKCDIWSAGVVVYILLGGLPPFSFGPGKRSNIHSLYKEIVFGDIGLDKPIWEIVSQEAKTMIKGIMTKHPGDRWSAKKVLECDWMNTSDTGKWGSSLIFRSMVFNEESCASLMPFEDAKDSNVTVPVRNSKQDSDSSTTQEEVVLQVHNIYPQTNDSSMIQEKVLLQQQVPQMQIQVDRRRGLTKSSRVPSTSDRTTQVLQLSLSAKGLKNISSLLQTSDPFAVVNIRGDNPDNKPMVIGQTNVVFNNLSPTWATIVFIEGYQPGVPFYFEVGIFDFDAKETDITERELQLHDSHTTHDLVAASVSRKLRKNEAFPHRVIGTAIFEVGEILASRDYDGRRRLQTGGEVYAQLEPCCEDTLKREFTFRLRAFNIKNRQSLAIKSSFSLFFEICRKQDRPTGATWIKVYQSHVVSNNMLPIWNQVQLDIRAVCNGDLNRAIKIIIWDHRWSGDHAYMGEFETTVNGLIYAKMSGERLATEMFHVKKKGKVTGTCEVLNASIQHESRGKLELPKGSDAPLEISLPGTPELQQWKQIDSHIYVDSE